MRCRLLPVTLAAFFSSVPVLAQAPDKHFIWEVRDGSGAPTYLVGAVHVLTKAHYPLPATLDAAFASSKVLIEELNLDELTNPATAVPLLQKAMRTDGRTLDQVISADTYKQVVARAEKAGLPLVAIDRMKPWMVALALVAPTLQEQGFDASLGVDRHYFERAKSAGLERRALETVEFQFDRFDQMPLAMQEAMLKALLTDMDTQVGNVKVMADAWAKGDVAALEHLLLGAFLESPELYERLLVERNRNWVGPVETCLQKDTPCFVVVGAAHLVGPQSLVALLQKKGYSVVQR